MGTVTLTGIGGATADTIGTRRRAAKPDARMTCRAAARLRLASRAPVSASSVTIVACAIAVVTSDSVTIMDAPPGR
jgi:hypothetical protein